MPLPIEEYAIIGDCQTAALVGRNGSIDWLCFPRFDSPACFAALLGCPENGRWQIRPRGEVKRVSRRYRDSTLILETEMETEEGAITLVDCMPERTKELDLARVVVGTKGKVEMEMELTLRFDYGSITPWVRKTGNGIRAIAGPDAVSLHSEVDLEGEGYTTRARFTISDGQRVAFVLVWYPSHHEPPGAPDAEEIVQSTEQWWRDWAARCSYEGEYQDAVRRSLLTLKALTYAPTGGIVAAPTTSLPEKIGGERNWDYRFCWLRDATITLYALISGGFTEEAKAWREWLLRVIAGKPRSLNIMYGVAGEPRLPELELEWLPGYEGSTPVRIGNAACKQFQLDVFGEVMDALHLARRSGLEVDDNAWRMQSSLLEYLEEVCTEPDEGIWEVRGGRQHFTHSRVMAWVAFDRMIKSAEHFELEGDISHWKKLRKAIHKDVCEKGFSQEKNSFVQYYGSDQVDASLLMIPMVGFLPATDSRMKGTLEAIEKELRVDGLVRRYHTKQGIDGLPPGEGAFLPCSFWLADNYLLQGRVKEGRELFEELLGYSNDVGLFSEEYDPQETRMLGNFPQAFTHVALINTACHLSRTKQDEVGERATA